MAHERFDMPASFGPSTIPPMTTVAGAKAVICSFETEPDALAALLPRQLQPGEPAVVSVAAIHYPATDYMGGRGYNEIVVSLAARHGVGSDALNAGFACVLWVDQFGALAAGREFQGLPKLMGRIDIHQAAEHATFGCAEYDAELLRASVTDLTPMSEDKLDAIRKAGTAVPTFGWKYIASPMGEPDADYVTVNYTRWSYDRAWTGAGTAEFLRPSFTDAPYGAKVAAALADLPVLRWRRAFVGEGTVIIDRTMTRRLPG